MNHRFKAVLGAVAALIATAAQAQQAPGVHQHDGFFLRLDAGLGYLESKETVAGTEAKVSGGGGEFGLAIGGALTENLILGGHLFALVASNPTVSNGGVSSSTSDSSWGLVGLGPQLTYYFMPANVYLSGTLALTRVTAKQGGADANSEYGGGLQLAVGKEWWVSDNWGLGVAGQLFGSTNKANSSSNAPTLSTWGAAVAFSATYN